MTKSYCLIDLSKEVSEFILKLEEKQKQVLERKSGVARLVKAVFLVSKVESFIYCV